MIRLPFHPIAALAAPLSASLLGAALLGAALLGACSDPVTGEPFVADHRMVLESPGVAVSAAVLDLTGVDAVTAVDGDVITRRHGDLLRVVVLLRVPGQLTFRVTTPNGEGEPSGTVLQVADAADRILESSAGFRIRVEP